MPVTAWRVLGLGQRRRVSSARRVWRAEMHGPNTVRVTMDTQCAVELRQSAGVASQDRHGLTARQRQAAWKIIPRITAALDSLGRGYTAR